jgi:membrane protein EpsK
MTKEKQTRNNFYTNILTLAATVIVGLYYTPYLVQKLGIVAYGIIPLALIINQYISVVTASLTSAFSRFYSVAIQQKKYDEASGNISTAFIIVSLLIVLLSPILFWIIYRIDSIFNIPVQFVSSAKYLFLFTIIGFFLSLITSLLNVTLYALNRLDWMNLIKICRIAFKLIFIIFFFSLVEIDIVYVGVANLLTELIILILSIVLFFKFSDSNISISFFRWKKATSYLIGVMAIWIIIHQLGDTAIYRIDNFIVNKYWGLSESGPLGAITELGNFILIGVSVISTLFGPLILVAYSKNNHQEVQRLAIDCSYISGSLSAIVAGIVAGYSTSILRFWLGESFVEFGNWLSIKLFSIPFFAAGGVLAYVYRTWNKVKFPALFTLILGGCNLCIVLLIISLGIKSISKILVVSCIFAILQSYFLNNYCVNKIYKGTLFPLVISAIKMSIIFIISFILCKAIEYYISFHTVLAFIISSIISFLFLFFLVYFLFFNRTLRKQFLNILY